MGDRKSGRSDFFLDRGCRNKNIGSYFYGGVFTSETNPKRARGFFKFGCNLKESTSCYNLGKLEYFEFNNNKGAIIYMKKACSLNLSYGCFNLGALLQHKFKDIKNAKKK